MGSSDAVVRCSVILSIQVPLSGMVEMVWPEAVVNKGWNLRRSTRKRRIALKYFFKCSRQGQWGRAKSTKTQPHAISSCFGENALNGPTSFSVDYCGARWNPYQNILSSTLKFSVATFTQNSTSAFPPNYVTNRGLSRVECVEPQNWDGMQNNRAGSSHCVFAVPE